MVNRLPEEAAEGEKSERAPAGLVRRCSVPSQSHLGAAPPILPDLAGSGNAP